MDDNRFASLPLQEYSLFSHMPDNLLRDIYPMLSARRFARGSSLMHMGERCGEIYLITAGSVKIMAQSPNSTQVIFSVLGPGEVLGELSAIDGQAHSANVVANEDTQTLVITTRDFLFLMRSHLEMSWNVTQILSRRLRRLSRQTEMLATLDVTGRLARQLLILGEDYGYPVLPRGIRIPLPLTQGDLSHMVGSSREKVNRVISRLKLQGAMDVDREGCLMLLDLPLLSRLCN